MRPSTGPTRSVEWTDSSRAATLFEKARTVVTDARAQGFKGGVDRSGIRAVIGESFSEIFFGNAVAVRTLEAARGKILDAAGETGDVNPPGIIHFSKLSYSGAESGGSVAFTVSRSNGSGLKGWTAGICSVMPWRWASAEKPDMETNGPCPGDHCAEKPDPAMPNVPTTLS